MTHLAQISKTSVVMNVCEVFECFYAISFFLRLPGTIIYQNILNLFIFFIEYKNREKI